MSDCLTPDAVSAGHFIVALDNQQTASQSIREIDTAAHKQQEDFGVTLENCVDRPAVVASQVGLAVDYYFLPKRNFSG
jgi:hypothetical protein